MTKFCNFLSNQYHFTYDIVKPCCWIKNLPTTSASILNPEGIADQVQRLSNINDWIPECEYCHNLEKNGATSPRLNSLKEEIFSDIDEPGAPIKIEVQIDEDCNGACLMCGPHASTTWEQYILKTTKDTKPFFKYNIPVGNRFLSVKNTIKWDSVKQIHFFGGEPMKTDTHVRILKLVTRPENVNLEYVTNGSILPDAETFEIWKKFKSVKINVSIDGIDEHFNYLRWPLQWKTVKSNLLEYANLDPNKFKIDTSFVATPFNILYQDRYMSWATDFLKDTNLKNNKLFNYPWPVMGVINLSCVPPSLADEVALKYGYNSRIYQLIKPFDTKKFKEFMDYIEYHDGHRDNSWRDTFPEVVHHFKNLG